MNTASHEHRCLRADIRMPMEGCDERYLILKCEIAVCVTKYHTVAFETFLHNETA